MGEEYRYAVEKEVEEVEQTVEEEVEEAEEVPREMFLKPLRLSPIILLLCAAAARQAAPFSSKTISLSIKNKKPLLLNMVNDSPQNDWVVGAKQQSPYEDQPFTAIDPNEVASVYSLMIRYTTLHLKMSFMIS